MSEIKRPSVHCRSQQGAKFTAVQHKIAGLQVRERVIPSHTKWREL